MLTLRYTLNVFSTAQLVLVTTCVQIPVGFTVWVIPYPTFTEPLQIWCTGLWLVAQVVICMPKIFNSLLVWLPINILNNLFKPLILLLWMLVRYLLSAWGLCSYLQRLVLYMLL